MWDEKGPAKLYAALKDDILDFIHHAQIVRKLKTFFQNAIHLI